MVHDSEWFDALRYYTRLMLYWRAQSYNNGNTNNKLCCVVHRYKLSVDDIFRGLSDVIIKKFRNDSPNGCHKLAACFLHELICSS
jgi:hypothetical protein